MYWGRKVDAQCRADPTKAGRPGAFPWRTRLLLWCSTSPWRGAYASEPEIVDLVERLTAEGWLVRTAYPRNFLLWRHGQVLARGDCRLVVLPRTFGRLSDLEINVFLATEIFRAWRQHTNNDGRVDWDGQLDRLCQRMAARSGVILSDHSRLYRRAEREILMTVWG
ncbi:MULTISPECIES: hypothetical protein [Chelatococcus]|uniref:Uncharacterized protein n=1 Tax=Chelatococcus caeni TaxID=1348468 RepID=A0A840BZQ5_9HYPH|nr:MULTISPECIES: hypothetical protein [Chelatococcus]MBB4015737.1 hypothetical protein [Chelatococcus caeni]